MTDKNFKNTIKVSGKRFDVKFDDSEKCFPGFIRQSSITIKFDNLGEEGRGNGIVLGFEGGEVGLHEREVARAA